MTPERAIEINSLLCEAWFVLHKIKQEPLPILEGISFVEAMEATEMVCEMEPVPLPNGGWQHRTHVNPRVLVRLHSWVVTENAMARIQAEHRQGRENVS